LIHLESWFKDKKPAILFGAIFWGKISVANLMIFKELLPVIKKIIQKTENKKIHGSSK